jgi:signal transduction histidine kinase
VSAGSAGHRAAWLPLRDYRFWVVQALIAVVFLLHELADGGFGPMPFAAVPHLAFEALFIFPLLYAALNFGLRGSLVTAAWVTLLMSSDITFSLAGMGRINVWAHYVELATLDVVAAAVGWRVEAERLARARAEVAETRYRQLYETARAPILLLDAEGLVCDANPAAKAIFDGTLIGRPGRSLVPGGLPLGEQGRRVLSLSDGRDYRFTLVSLPAGSGTALTQAIFEDVTEEHRDRRLATRYAALVVRAEEGQRRRLARELHDEPLQVLAHLARQLGSLAEAPGIPAAAADGLARAHQQALDAALRLRSLARELRPPTLDHLGLVAALSSFLADVDEEADLQTDLQVTGEAVRAAGDIELGAFRIIQEAVRNSVRHAGARRLRVTVGFGADELRLTVADDGRGFTLDELDGQAATHLGLVGMRERARLLGGHLEVRSAPSAGTVIHARMPLRTRQDVASAEDKLVTSHMSGEEASATPSGARPARTAAAAPRS